MNVGIFVDGKNFYHGWKHWAGVPLDFPKLSQFIVDTVEGEYLSGVYYYTSIDKDGDSKLLGFLHNLKKEQGWFVHSLNRKSRHIKCEECDHETSVTNDKNVDISMVTDIMKMAAADTVDVVVIVGGDSDHGPVFTALKSLGIQAWIANWGPDNSTKNDDVYNYIDLSKGMDQFCKEKVTKDPNKRYEEAFFKELRTALDKFQNGYLGVNFWLNRWRSNDLPRNPEARKALLDKAVAAGKVQIYTTDEGKSAIRM